MRHTALLLVATTLASCPGTGRRPVMEGPAGHAKEAVVERLLVALPSVPLYEKQGGTGDEVATLHQGVLVAVDETSGSGWSHVTTMADVSISGWLRADALGCRLAAEQPILTSPKDQPGEHTPLGREGAMLRILSRQGDDVHVESAPEKIVWYETGGKNDPVLEHQDFTGYLAQGWVPASACIADHKPFYPRAPKDGDLFCIAKPTAINAAPGGLASQLPGKALAKTRWVSIAIQGAWVQGRTDGQIVVKGFVPIDAIGPSPLTNPLYKLVKHEMKDYEILGEQPLTDASGKILAVLAPGQDVKKIGEDVRGCEVKTPGPVEVHGFVPCHALRDLSTIPEAAIEYGVIDGGSPPPDRGPMPNPVPID